MWRQRPCSGVRRACSALSRTFPPSERAGSTRDNPSRCPSPWSGTTGSSTPPTSPSPTHLRVDLVMEECPGQVTSPTLMTWWGGQVYLSSSVRISLSWGHRVRVIIIFSSIQSITQVPHIRPHHLVHTYLWILASTLSSCSVIKYINYCCIMFPKTETKTSVIKLYIVLMHLV